jgi:hypothetical protein
MQSDIVKVRLSFDMNHLPRRWVFPSRARISPLPVTSNNVCRNRHPVGPASGEPAPPAPGVVEFAIEALALDGNVHVEQEDHHRGAGARSARGRRPTASLHTTTSR